MHKRHQGPYICAPDPSFRLERVIAERLAGMLPVYEFYHDINDSNSRTGKEETGA